MKARTCFLVVGRAASMIFRTLSSCSPFTPSLSRCPMKSTLSVPKIHLLEQLSQRLNVIFPTGCVDENIVPVEQDVVYVFQDSAQSSLQSGTAVYHPKRHSQEFPMAIRCHESSFGDILLSNFDLSVSLTQINF